MSRSLRLLARFGAGLLAACSAPAATNYYVSSSAGNDGNSGIVSTAPWKNLAKVNAVNLVHGDRIYLKSGDTFTDAGLAILGPNDAGTAADPIVVDIYSGTTAATIKPPTGQHGINIYNTGGLTVRNLILTGPGLTISDTTPTYGVSLWCDQTNGTKNATLTFDSLTISNFYQGIVVGANQPSFSGFKDVTINNCTVTTCLSEGIVTYGYVTGASMTQQSHQNLKITNTKIDHCKGDHTTTGEHSGSGIIMAGTLGGTIDQCVVHDCGGESNDATGGGPVGIWCWGCDSVTIQHCLVYNQRTTPGVSDGGGFDIDGGATRCIIQYCYSYNNDGPGFEVVEFKDAGTLSDATVRYNISWKDGRRHNQGSLSVYNGNSTAASCTNVKFYNNIVVSQDVPAAPTATPPEPAYSNPCVSYPDYSGPVVAKFYNNVFYAIGTAKLVNVTYNTSSFTFKGNLYYSSANTPQWTWGTTTYAALTAWRAATGTPEKNGSTNLGLVADPLLGTATAGTLPAGFAATAISQLATMTQFIPNTTSSPVINSGQNLTTSTYGSLSVGSFDFKGATIPVSAYDIGAYEKH